MGHREQADDTDGPRKGTEQKSNTGEEPHQRRQQVTTTPNTFNQIAFSDHSFGIDWDIERVGLRPATFARGCVIRTATPRIKVFMS